MKYSCFCVFIFALGCGGASATHPQTSPDMQSVPIVSGPDFSVSQTGPSDLAGADLGPTNSLVASRPYELHVPTGYNANVAVPLVVLLHGLASDEDMIEAYFKVTPIADKHTFLYAHPNGLKGTIGGQRFFNATDACCDIFHQNPDDVAYLKALLSDVRAKYNVDPKRIFIMGHSNGGYMAHRLACDDSAEIAAIASLSGAVWNDATKCAPTDPIAILEVHGTDDQTVKYDGGNNNTETLGTYPSAMQTAATWAAKNHCTDTLTNYGPALDLVDVTGAETQPAHYVAGCTAAVELWTVQTGVHEPSLNAGTVELWYEWLAMHPKP
jgi:polyhydroxybutyrate depolymerase